MYILRLPQILRLHWVALGALTIALVAVTTGPASAQSPVGRWRYQYGSFTDDITLWPDGRAIGIRDPKHVGKWRLQGSTIITNWPNGYRHEFPARPSFKHRRGPTIDPRGTPHTTTFTWLGPLKGSQTTNETLAPEIPRSIGPIHWCLACPRSPERRIDIGFTVPKGVRTVVVRVRNGADNSGDRAVEVMVGDPSGRIILATRARKNSWEEFRCRVRTPGDYFVTLRDLDTASTGPAPGNGGSLKILLK